MSAAELPALRAASFRCTSAQRACGRVPGSPQAGVQSCSQPPHRMLRLHGIGGLQISHFACASAMQPPPACLTLHLTSNLSDSLKVVCFLQCQSLSMSNSAYAKVVMCIGADTAIYNFHSFIQSVQMLKGAHEMELSAGPVEARPIRAEIWPAGLQPCLLPELHPRLAVPD